MVARGGGVGEVGGGGQKVQTSSYKINKSWECMHNKVTTVNNTNVFESC